MLGSFLRDMPATADQGAVDCKQPSPLETSFFTKPVSLETTQPEPIEESKDYEIVLGGRQIASVSFVILVSLTVFTSLSYLVGRWSASKSFGASSTVVHAGSTESALKTPPAAPKGEPLVVSSVTPTPAKQPAKPSTEVTANEPPLFSEPVPGTLYLQMAAVDRGVANVMVNGFRRLGFPSIVSAGPTERVFRVLVGPLADAKAASAARNALEAFGLAPFTKKIGDTPARKPESPARKSDSEDTGN